MSLSTKHIFDIGMYDASDTKYYLEEGYKVVAVEANPALVERAKVLLADYINAGHLQIVNAAISTDNATVELILSGDDLGSSSVFTEKVASRFPIGKFSVPGITLEQLFEKHGVPYYLKVDIEGADGLCVRALSAKMRPPYLSFEIGEDFEELVSHIASIGYTRLKVINQRTFRELANEKNLVDRLSRKIVRTLGYAEPQYIKRNGRFFSVGHSTGPVPWQSDGEWLPLPLLKERWRKAQATTLRENNWYDCHAM